VGKCLMGKGFGFLAGVINESILISGGDGDGVCQNGR
jgi:hypothetical protein